MGKNNENNEKIMKNYGKNNENNEKIMKRSGSRTSTHPPGVLQRALQRGTTTGNIMEKRKMEKMKKSYL